MLATTIIYVSMTCPFEYVDIFMNVQGFYSMLCFFTSNWSFCICVTSACFVLFLSTVFSQMSSQVAGPR